MAILSKIRERSIALIAVIGLALFAFVLDPSQLTDFFNSSKVNVVGEVDGETISRQEYSERLDTYRARTNNRFTEMQAAKNVWLNLIREKIYTKQLDKAGITIGEEDIWNQIINAPSIMNNPQFQNTAGLFDEDKFKVFLKDAQESEDQQMWKAWQDYLAEMGNNLKKTTYDNLLNAGLGSSLKEGEYTYWEENVKVSADFVYVPYSTIPDSTITITKKDIANYIDEHPTEFEVEATRSISFVKFDIAATDEDKTNIKNELKALLKDRTEYNNVSKRDEVIKGLANTTDYQTFFDENKSDMALNEIYRTKGSVPEVIREEFGKSKVGDIIGPFENRRKFNLVKITDIIRRPDSVKSSHILIPFIGSAAAGPTTVKTEAQAKKSADSIFKLVRRNKKRFGEIADAINSDGSKGKQGDIGWVNHTMAMSDRFDNDFANFIFDNKTGKIDIVKTKFGYHIIRIDEQKNYQPVFKTVIFARDIEPSEKTENAAFQKAEEFALEIAKNNNNFFSVARDKKYTTKQAVGFKVLDERLPGIDVNARQIVTWAFQGDTERNTFKRFDLDRSYVVAFLTDITNEGLMEPGKAIGKVRPILIKERKAEIIKAKIKGNTVEDIAKNQKQTVRKVAAVTMKSPTISGVGYEPKIVGAMYKAGLNNFVKNVAGDRGVYAFKITKVEEPTALPNYEAYRQRIAEANKTSTLKVFGALKKVSDIEDNRAFYYGIND